jgi:hypothetical protein
MRKTTKNFFVFFDFFAHFVVKSARADNLNR